MTVLTSQASTWNFGISTVEDADDDGVLDAEDDCPLMPNPDQADLDSDGIGDICDDDNSVEIDAAPGRSGPPVVGWGNGLLEVAILGSATFDSAEIAISSVAVGAQGDIEGAKAKCKDVNKDGYLDLRAWFHQGDIWMEGSTELCLTADLGSGIEVYGCDQVGLLVP